jgi:hypothetical protein
MEDSINVQIMKIVKDFDYLVNKGEHLTIEQLHKRAQYCPGIMEEPELQQLCQITKYSTIESVSRNSMGLWWTFKS